MLYALTIEGADLYAAGYERDVPIPPGMETVAKIWKVSGGTVTEFATLTGGESRAWVYALTIEGADTYAAGIEWTNTYMGAQVWKVTDGTVTASVALTDGTNEAKALAILPE
jgi:hypothetical protein